MLIGSRPVNFSGSGNFTLDQMRPDNPNDLPNWRYGPGQFRLDLGQGDRSLAFEDPFTSWGSFGGWHGFTECQALGAPIRVMFGIGWDGTNPSQLFEPTGPESQPGPPSDPVLYGRWKFRVIVMFSGLGFIPPQLFYSNYYVTFWDEMSYVSDSSKYRLYATAGSGSYSWTWGMVLDEFCDFDTTFTRATYRHRRRNNDFHLSFSASVNVTYSSGSPWGMAGIGSTSGTPQYFTAIPISGVVSGNPGDGDVSSYTCGVVLRGLGVSSPALSGGVTVDDPTLQSLYSGGIDARRDEVHLTGTVASATLAWVGAHTPTFHDTASSPTFQDWLWPPVAYPGGSILWEPSWALSFVARNYQYSNGLMVDAQMRYIQGSDPSLPGTQIGTWQSGTDGLTAGRFPTTGYFHTFSATCSDGRIKPDIAWISGGSPPGNPCPSSPYGANCGWSFGATGSLLGAVALSNSLTGLYHRFGIANSWADLYGTLLASYHLGIAGHSFPQYHQTMLPARFPLGDLQFPGDYLFGAFSDQGHWSGYSLPGPIAIANPNWRSGPAVAQFPDRIEFTNLNNAPCWVTTYQTDPKAGYYWRPFAHRYHTFQAQGSVPGSQFWIAVSRNRVGQDISGGLFLWRFTVNPSNSWVTYSLDLAKPDWVLSVDGTNRFAYADGGEAVQASRWMPYFSDQADAYSGTRLWIGAQDPGGFKFRNLTGTHRSDGSRVPYRLYGPQMEWATEPLNLHALQGDNTQRHDFSNHDLPTVVGGVRSYANIYRLIANGMHGFTVSPSVVDSVGTGVPVGIVTVWARMKQFLDSESTQPNALQKNDTGIVVTTAPTSPLEGLGVIAADNASMVDGAGMFLAGGRHLGAPASETFNAQARSVATRLCYGAGGLGVNDPLLGDPGFSSVIRLIGERVLLGSVVGLLPIGPGATAELHDEPTESLIATTVLDAEGFFEFPNTKYGVVFPWSNADTGALPLFTADHIGGKVTYTPIGATMSPFWLKVLGASGLITDGAGYVTSDQAVAGETLRLEVVSLDRFADYLTPLWVPIKLRGVANVQYPDGRYLRADVSSQGRIIVRASNFSTPPFARQGDVTDGPDTEPKLAWVPGNGALLAWLRGSSVLAAKAADFGASFDPPVLLFTQASHPAIAIDPLTGILSALAYGSGLLAGALQHPGETSATVFNVQPAGGVGTIAIEDDGIDMAYGPDGKLWAAVRLAGAGNVALMRSEDRGRSFDPVVSVLPGAKHPALTFRPPSILIAAGWIGGGIQVVSMTTGQTAASAPTPLRNKDGTPLIVAEDSFHMAAAFEGRARVVLAALMGGDSLPSEWASGDLVATVDPVS